MCGEGNSPRAKDGVLEAMTGKEGKEREVLRREGGKTGDLNDMQG